MFLKRSGKKEMIDDFSITDDRIDSALSELKIINRFLGGDSVSRNGLREFYRRINGNMPYKVLDAGSGSSDILLKLKNSFGPINIYALDKNRQVCFYSKRKIMYLDIIG